MIYILILLIHDYINVFFYIEAGKKRNIYSGMYHVTCTSSYNIWCLHFVDNFF